ncbi:type II secretion system protein GspE [candidate division GN15 bacterium]|uniref:Type II secretion system protein GspE n=1 Tax=candidate division GN15 bacterium TaxID=2072418 RepID=A0A855XEI5_9BACT|nr:MAG: type II secretion system protein GspE [candidate division GN15 bacterium]
MTRKKIGDLLVEKGYITPEILKAAMAEQVATGKRLGAVLVDRGLVTEDQLMETISERLGIPQVSLANMVLPPHAIQRISAETARRYTVIPIFLIGNTLTLAMADPLNIIAIDEIKYQTGCEIKRAVCRSSEIRQAIDQYYSVADSLHDIIGTRRTDVEEDIPVVTAAQQEEAESPIIKLVTLIITKAVNEGASDVHIEPEETSLRIRYRINGSMREEAAPPKAVQNEIISRIKIAAEMDVSEKRLPQDGRFAMNVDGAMVDLRVSTLPTIHGEKVVIRILDRRNLLLSFSQLGFRDTIQEAWNAVVRKAEGIVLISGPTSSGKTSTLYATLQAINSVDKNIITVEDPVEYSLSLINQIQINEKAGLTFPICLRSMLRQNPDVIMIGEIRDSETAHMAIRSALTGHLVFSTIHTNDAPSAITRLIDMGVENYLVTAAVKGVLAQRLVRLNCPHCLASYRPPETLLRRAGLMELADAIDFRRSTGCNQCRDTGYGKLTGIFEFMEITNSITELILQGASLSRIRKDAARSGYIPLFEAGLEKLMNGAICLEELLKETSNIEDYFGSGRSGELEERRAVTV